ncbi:hypothetical protein [Nitrobacter winogradskyi]|uniref:hypothetical protein n=1 Tax=Nitrobacter winogradskyi TaxID=913 RepID=UPI00059C127F|nr:hypothetical protein [Nitrobacter winogradskyi]
MTLFGQDQLLSHPASLVVIDDLFVAVQVALLERFHDQGSVTLDFALLLFKPLSSSVFFCCESGADHAIERLGFPSMVEVAI